MITEMNLAQSSRRTKRRGRHPHRALAPTFVRTAPPGHHIDGHGLYLYVQPTGARSWIQRLVIRGRRCELGLGAVALVSLAEAREKALANRKLAREGGDPLADKRRAQGVPTFADAATAVIEQQRPPLEWVRQDWPRLKLYDGLNGELTEGLPRRALGIAARRDPRWRYPWSTILIRPWTVFFGSLASG